MLKMKLVELPARGQAVSISLSCLGIPVTRAREYVDFAMAVHSWDRFRELRAALCIHNRIPPVIAVVQKVDSGPSRDTAEPERERTI
jgi:predicted nucleotidyltransferase